MPGLGQIDLQYVLVLLVTFVVAITLHEFMHAWTAWMLGDDTARLLGRISLNPVVHFDPIGFFMFILIAVGIGPGLAWGKPVPVNVSRLRPIGRFGKHVSMGLVALAGPLANVALGAVAALSLRLSEAAGGGDALYQAVFTFMIVNFGLAAFNMIPVPPLDGSRILAALLPDFWQPILAQFERYGFLILLLLILVGGQLGGSVIGAIAYPVRDLLVRTFYGLPI